MVLGGRVHAKKGTVEVTSWGAVHHVRCKSSPAQSARRTAVTLHYSPEWAIRLHHLHEGGGGPSDVI